MTPKERFWAKVDRRGPDECWPWTGGTHDGYGLFTTPSTGSGAHRYSYWLATGESVRGWVVRHSCDNRPCVNPGHLSLGTIADNIRDRDERGRQARGERSNLSKLTEADVLEIRRRDAAGERQNAIAVAFETDPSNVNRICNGRTWKHLPMEVAS